MRSTNRIDFGLLRAALLVGLVAGGIFAFVVTASALPYAALPIGMLTYLGWGLLSVHYVQRIGLEPGDYLGMLGSVIGGPIFPIYEGFFKISNLEQNCQLQKEEIEESFSDLVAFFNQDLNEVDELLQARIQGAKSSLNLLKGLPCAAESAVKEIQEKMAQYEKALGEFEKAREYFTRFQSKAR